MPHSSDIKVCGTAERPCCGIEVQHSQAPAVDRVCEGLYNHRQQWPEYLPRALSPSRRVIKFLHIYLPINPIKMSFRSSSTIIVRAASSAAVRPAARAPVVAFQARRGYADNTKNGGEMHLPFAWTRLSGLD